MILSVGFTGTRHGMTKPQSLKVFSALHNGVSVYSDAHHGCCMGGDAEFHEMCLILGIPIKGHPPSLDRFRDKSLYGFIDLATPNDYHTRDRHIVRSSDFLISAPLTRDPVPHSGTWYTTNYARKKRKPVVMVYPSGETEIVSHREYGNLNDLFDGLIDA